MRNVAPVADLKLTPEAVLQLPNREIILDASGTFDANKKAVLTYLHSCSNKNVVIENPSAQITKATINFTDPAFLTFKVKVTDKGLLSHEATKNIEVKTMVQSKKQFGAMFGSHDDDVAALNLLGMDYVRLGQPLKTYNGGNNSIIDKVLKAGKKVILNTTWEQGTPKQFIKAGEVSQYKSQLSKFFDRYAGKIEVAVCENEPTTDAFWGNSPIDDYLQNMLTPFVEICKKYGVKSADGAIHAYNVERVKNGSNMNEQNVKDVATMIKFYKTLQLDYVNVHHKAVNAGDAAVLKVAADYLRQETGHQVMSNEWHLESNDTAVMDAIVKGWNEGGYDYSLCFSGDNAPVKIVENNKLTKMGEAYKKAVAAL